MEARGRCENDPQGSTVRPDKGNRGELQDRSVIEEGREARNGVILNGDDSDVGVHRLIVDDSRSITQSVVNHCSSQHVTLRISMNNSTLMAWKQSIRESLVIGLDNGGNHLGNDQ